MKRKRKKIAKNSAENLSTSPDANHMMSLPADSETGTEILDISGDGHTTPPRPSAPKPGSKNLGSEG